MKKIRFAREDNGRVRFLSPAEEARLFAHCHASLRTVIITALNTGLRRSELLSLAWNDVDFERGLITVRAAYAKNGESRSIPINALLRRTLEAVRINTTNGPVFRKQDGESYRDFRTAFENAGRQAAIPDFTFHDLRHTCAIRLVMVGVDLPTVKERILS